MLSSWWSWRIISNSIIWPARYFSSTETTHALIESSQTFPTPYFWPLQHFYPYGASENYSASCGNRFVRVVRGNPRVFLTALFHSLFNLSVWGVFSAHVWHPYQDAMYNCKRWTLTCICTFANWVLNTHGYFERRSASYDTMHQTTKFPADVLKKLGGNFVPQIWFKFIVAIFRVP